MKVKLYVLIDPTTNKIRYIGRTKNELSKRLIGHISKSRLKKNHKDCWIQSLLSKGYCPKIKKIGEVEGWTNSHIIERKLIQKGKFRYDLVNLDDRGEGEKNKKITDEQKKKISETLKKGYLTGKIKVKKKTPVFVFDLKGNFIIDFESLKSCSETLKIPMSSLEKVLKKTTKRYKNYQITYGENPGIYQKRTNYNQKNKEIVLLDQITNTEIKFCSFKKAAIFLNVSSPTIRRNINKVYKNYQILCPNKIG